MLTVEAHENIFEVAGGYSPAEALNLSVRSDLMLQLEVFVKDKGFTQKEAANFFGVHQPRISQLLNGHIDKFSVDMLLSLLSKTGLTASIQFSEKKAA